MNPAAYYLSSIEINIQYIPTELSLGNGQIWDLKNLNTSIYSDGTLIPKINSNSLWTTLNTGACRFYNNDSITGSVYGRLYNWYAVNGVYDYPSLIDPLLRKDIAPAGWRVATIADWQTLSNYATALTPTGSVGSKLKEVGITHWLPTNTGATNLTGFTALPGGYVTGVGSFTGINNVGYFWPLDGNNSSPSLSLAYNTTTLGFRNDGLAQRGYSVRLIKKDITIFGFTTTLGTALAKSVPTGGNIPTSYTEIPTEIGIVFGTSINPNIIAQSGNIRIYTPEGLGSYSINLTGLTANTTYYIRAYAKITTGTAYADNVTFTTRNGIATLTTNTVTDIVGTTATCGGNITDDGGDIITARGVCWNTSTNPTIANSKTIDAGTIGSFTSSITGLSSNTLYYVRAYSTNSVGTTYGNEQSFTSAIGTGLILDLYPSAHHAYSLRKLRGAYTGFCLRVRRTAITSTEVNVRFNSNGTIGLDSLIDYASGTATTATTLGQFAAIAGYGTADAGVTANQNIFVVTWFDQSGNGKNPTNATVAQQPRLISSATADLERSGGKVAVRFVKTASNNLLLADTTANVNNMSSYFVGAFVGSTSGQIGYSLATSSRFYFPYYNGTNIYASYGATVTAITLETGFNTNRKLYELISPTVGSTTLVQGWTNGVAQGTRAIVSAATQNIQIGTAGNNYYDGYVQEIIGWQSNGSREGKETNINTYWGIYL